MSARRPEKLGSTSLIWSDTRFFKSRKARRPESEACLRGAARSVRTLCRNIEFGDRVRGDLGGPRHHSQHYTDRGLQKAIVHFCFIIERFLLALVVIHSSLHGNPLLSRRLRTCTCRFSFCRNTACLLCGRRPNPGSPRPSHFRAEVEPAVHFSRPAGQTLRERAQQARQTKKLEGSMAPVPQTPRSQKTGASTPMMLVAAMRRPLVRCRLLPVE